MNDVGFVLESNSDDSEVMSESALSSVLGFGSILDSFLGHLCGFVADTGQIQEDFARIRVKRASGLDFGVTLESFLDHLCRFVADTRFLKTVLLCRRELDL